MFLRPCVALWDLCITFGMCSFMFIYFFLVGSFPFHRDLKESLGICGGIERSLKIFVLRVGNLELGDLSESLRISGDL